MKKNRVKRIFLIHFLPLELYPPIMNLIDYFSIIPGYEVIVVSNREGNNWLSKTYVNNAGNIKIYRLGEQSKFSKKRFFNYLLFYPGCFFLLLRYQPSVIFYFETISSWPALIYKKLSGKKLLLMAHYHEYTSPAEYNSRMLLTKWMHRMEVKMYKRFSWISQTNEIRLQKFRDDNNLNQIADSMFQLMPNYPPASWRPLLPVTSTQKVPLRLVYVGSLGYKNMYLQEVVDWLATHRKEFTLDVYAYNMDQKARELFRNNTFSNISYHGGCNYKSIPEILKDYDIGLVIYKPFSQNTIHAVSNKVFEYLACGLDVWFSTDMTYTMKYVKEDSYPKVVPVDFSRLELFDYKRAISKAGLKYLPSGYNYEIIYKNVVNHINYHLTADIE